MKKFTARASVYLILTLIGAMFAIYSIKLMNPVLLIVSILFAVVSADNIYCGLGKNKSM